MDNKWDMLESSNEDREKIWTKNRTFAGDVWFRFRHKPTSIAGFVIILLLILFAAFGPLFTKYSYSVQDLEVVNIPPRMKVYETPDNTGYLYITQAMKVLQVNSDGTLGIQLKKVREESERMMTIFDCNGTEVALYYGQKPYVIANPENNTIYRSKNIWNKSYLLGTDNLGRDILTRLMYGTRVSLMVAFVAVAVNLVIGVLYGGISGYLGGNVDAVMMRIVDIIYAMPSMIYVILIMMVLGSNVRSILIGICIPGWIGMARQVRGQLIALKEQEFSMAALVIGASDARILFRHLLINAIGPIIVQITFLVPNAIFTEAFLSFIGIGISAPMASWGSMAQDARQVLTMHPGQLLLPTICICITIFSLNFLGEGIGDAFNPKKTRG